MSLEIVGFIITLLTTVAVVCIFFERLRSSINNLTATLNRMEGINQAEHKAQMATSQAEHKEMLLLLNKMFQSFVEINTKLDHHIREK